MRLPRPRRRRLPAPDLQAATQARKKAERDLAATRAETPFYQALGDSLRIIRENNNLADAFHRSFRGGHT